MIITKDSQKTEKMLVRAVRILGDTDAASQQQQQAEPCCWSTYCWPVLHTVAETFVCISLLNNHNITHVLGSYW